MIKDTIKNILDNYLVEEKIAFEKQYSLQLLNLGYTELPKFTWQALKLMEDVDYSETHIVYDLLQLQLYYEKL